MPMTLRLKEFCLMCALMILGARLFAVQGQGSDESDFPKYKTGFAANIKLGIDLYKALKPKYKEFVHIQPIALEDSVMPFVRLVEEPGDDPARPERKVFISSGFVDLMNNVAHAKAIDTVEKGYFSKYLILLSKETGETALAELPKLSDKRFWSDDMMNEQLSNFNQMVGMVVAIKLSHYYLGHYKKYSDRLRTSDNKVVPINTLLTPAEWDEALKLGSINALNCGFGVEGVKALYDSIEQMPHRPPWTLSFLPAEAQVKKIKRSLEKTERDFFAGKTE